MESKKKQNKQNKKGHRYKEHFDSCQMGGIKRTGENGEGIKKYKLVVTKWPQGYKVQHREYCKNYVWRLMGTRFIG